MRFEWLAVTLALVLVAAFAVSFATRWLAEREAAPLPAGIEEVRTPEPPAGVRTRVEVLNASGIPGRARLATERLRDRGFDVVYFGNARGHHPDTSVVLDRTGEVRAAEAVAAALGVARVESRPDQRLLLDATVVLGRDWDTELTDE